jgi:hypothetical protein
LHVVRWVAERDTGGLAPPAWQVGHRAHCEVGGGGQAAARREVAEVGDDAAAEATVHLDHASSIADAGPVAAALFLSAASIGSRHPDGRLSPRSINLICEQIGRWHDAEHGDPARHISPLRPHDLRHSFAFAVAEATGSDAYELERRLGHQSQRYLTATPTRPRTSPLATSSRCVRRRLDLVTRFLPAPHFPAATTEHGVRT